MVRLARDDNYSFRVYRPEIYDYWFPRGLIRNPSLSMALSRRLDVKLVVAIIIYSSGKGMYESESEAT